MEQPSESDDRVAWRFALVDHDGRWAWPKVGDHDHSEVLRKLAGYEDRAWRQIQPAKSAGGGKEISVDSLCKEAQQRLVDLQLDDRDLIAEFRLTGTQRVWALRTGSVLHLLWWDPDHEVCPSVKKHT